MADIFSQRKRSEIMSAVKGKNTSPERLVRSLAHRLGYRFCLNIRRLPGTPDLVFFSRCKAVFVHGCFWHGHSCKRGRRLPEANAAYWLEKISRNKARDRRDRKRLNRLGWKTLVIWECELRQEQRVAERLRDFLGHIGI